MFDRVNQNAPFRGNISAAYNTILREFYGVALTFRLADLRDGGKFIKQTEGGWAA